MQKRKSFFNNEMEQRFSLRKYTIGLCSVCLGFVVIGMGSQTVKADTVNDVEKSSAVQENKAQDTDSANTDALAESKTNTSDSATAKPNTTPTETKENEAGSVVMATPKTADSNNSASVNTLDQSKSASQGSVATDADAVSTADNMAADSAPTTPVTNKALHESNSQAQPSSSIDNTHTKLVRRPVMRLAAATATNSDELIVGKDVTISDFSVTTADRGNEFENSHANIKFTMHADDPSALVDKRLTIQVDTKVWNGFYSSEQQDSNPATISYQGQVIGTLNYGYPFKFVYITFNNHVKDYTSINLQSDLVVAGDSQNDSLYRTDLYTPTQAKDGQTYYLTNDIVIGQQKYSSNLPSTIHYYALNSEFVSSVTDVTTTSYTQGDSKLYAGTFYKTPDGIYYSRSAYYSGNSLYDTKSGRPGYLSQPCLYVGTDIVTDHTQSYTATFDIDQTKLSPDQDLKFTPITSYYLDKDHWDDKNLLPNTRDVYVDKSHTSSTTVTADATVIKNGVIFNKLNGQSLATRIVNAEYTKSHWSFPRSTNYIKQDGRFYITPALFKQLQAVAESDQNLTEAIKTVTTTGKTAEIKLVNPIDTGVKATITTSDGKTKEVPLLIDTIRYAIRTASTAPRGSILVSAQGKTAKVYHPGDQNIPAVVDQSQLTKTITRTINVHEPDKSVTTTKQTVTLTQSVSVVDGKDVTYNGDWKAQGDSQWASYDVPSVPGYTASQSHVVQQAVTDATKDQTVNITYTANDGTQTIVYQDEDGSEVGKQVVPGKTDETVKVTPDVPDGYVVKGEIPTEVTIKPDDTPITVTVEHGKSHVTPDKPVNKGDLIPGTKDKHYPEGLTHNDLNKTITREITITDPTGKKSTTTQTVTFTRGATVDEVTNKVTYDDWSESGKHTFDKVDVPTVPGYTASGEVPSIVVTPETKDQTVNITYTANDGTQTIVYQDEDGSEVGKQVVPGKTDETVKVTPDVPDGYVVKGEIPTEVTIKPDDTPITVTVEHGKSHVTPDKPVNKGDLIPGTKDKHYPEGLTHNDLNKTVTREITITDPTGKKTTTTQTVTFTRGATVDEVTNEVTYDDWSENGKHTFDKVDVPNVPGYTASGEVPSIAVTPETQSSKVDITYTANAQTATITYIDDTEKKSLGSDKQNGKFNQVITFEHDPAEIIKGLEEKGYKLVSNDFNSNKYQADNSNNVFYVHFVHDTKKVSREHSASFTVYYIYKDSRQAKPDHEQTLSFTENGIQDLVTQKITWTPADSQKFDDVATPVITGYTPNQDKVIGQTANFETGNREVTVTYSPNVQIGHINYIDDDTKKTLTRDDFSGRTNEHEDYTSTDRIQEFENKGYELVSNDYPDGGFNFDNNDRQDQVFNVHFKHGTVTVTTKNPQTPNTPINPDPQSPKYPKDINNTNSDAKRTIDYNFKDGKTARPTVTDNLHFERTVVIDKVTGKVLSDTWTQSQNFSDIQTPAIQGYTPDRTSVSDKNIGHDHQDIIEHVVYSPDTQHMTITYIDDTTGETLHTDNPNGVSDQDAKYTTGNTIKQYEEKHYKLVSDSTNGKDLIFDHDDNADQTYEVHFVHGTHTINQTTSPKQTVHYIYADGLVRQGKATDDNVQQLSFKRDGYNDEVTDTDHWNAWTPANSNYNAVDSPVIQGYTPDKSVVEKSTVNPTDKDTEITVVYYADKQTAHVIYIDKTTNDVLTSKDLSGKSDEDSEYNTEDKIGQYKSQHYVLFEDETNGKNVVFDHNDQQDQTYYVYFVHGEQKVNRQDTVTSTINYKFEDGKTAQPTVTQTKHFSEDGVKDLVTGKIAWDEAKPQKFEDVATKSIVGYTPDKDNVVGNIVKFGDQDVEVTVIYHNNAQTAKITYIDDTEKKTLSSDQQNGKFDQAITFGTAPTDEITNYEKQGYKLVSNNFKPGIKYQNDNKFNIFEVHLVHTYEPVETSQTITETIHYIDVNGKPVAPDYVAKAVIEMTGTRDKVTNSITWNTPSTGHFDEVISPEVPNMTPDKKFIPSRNVQYGDSDITENVVYTSDETSREPEKPNDQGKPNSKTPEKPNKSGNPTSKTSEKSNKSSKEVSKQFGTIAKTTIPEKPIDSRTVDNHVSAKTTTKQELPQTGTTANTGIWTGLVSIITSLGLLGASKKRKKN